MCVCVCACVCVCMRACVRVCECVCVQLGVSQIKASRNVRLCEIHACVSCPVF